MHREGYAAAKADDALFIQRAVSGDSGAFGKL